MTDPLTRPLGSLEQATMEVLWKQAPASVHEVHEALVDRELAYTTVMTILDRLHKKGLVVRSKRSQAYLYEPVMGREAFERRLVSSVLGGMPNASRDALLAGFLDFAGEDLATLDQLERLIAERKRDAE